MRVTDGAASLVYGADGAFSEELIAFAAAADLLLLEATYDEDSPELARHGHMTGTQAGEIAERAGAHRLLLTHLGPWAERNTANLHGARSRFHGDVELVRDGAVYIVCADLSAQAEAGAKAVRSCRAHG